MLDYTECRYDTRGLDRGEAPVPCEQCFFSLLNNKPGSLQSGVGMVSDIHHIISSFRGERRHSDDGSDIIGLCYNCHQRAHENNDQSMRIELLAIVNETKDLYKKLGDKDKLWLLVNELHKGWAKQNQ